MSKFKSQLKRLLATHRPSHPPIFLVATPRGGSTWLAELIWSQPSMRFVNEPFNIRRHEVASGLGIVRWSELYSRDVERRFDPYLDAVIAGKNRSSDVLPLKQWRRIGWRLRTDRTLLKIIHAGSNLIPWMCTRFGGRAVLMLRHPLATAVSRKVFPFLGEVQDSHLFDSLSAEQREVCEETLRSSNAIEKGVLAWCLFMAPALRNNSQDVLVVTYEQLVVDPEPVLEALGTHLDLPDLARMREALMVPSLSSFLCDEVSIDALNERKISDRAQVLLSKWRRFVSADEEVRVMSVLKAFGLSAYKAGDLLPDKALWIDGGPAAG